MRNAGLSFVCRPVPLKVENSQSLFTAALSTPARTISFPVAHHDGNYQADAATLDRLEGEGRVAFRYLDEVNGSARQIAGILNDAGNVLGLMPHPERAIEPAHGNADGRRLFEGLLEAVASASGDALQVEALAAGLSGRQHAHEGAVGAVGVDHDGAALEGHRIGKDDDRRGARGRRHCRHG